MNFLNSIYSNSLIILIGLFTSWFITRCMIVINISDTPIHRSSHTEVTPKSGGIGVVIGFFTSLYIFYHQKPFILTSRPSLLMCAFLITVAMGLLDDIKTLSFKKKFIGQILSAILVVASGLSVQSIPLPFLGDISLGAMGGILTVIGIVGCINVFNFMDGLNGLLSGSSIIATIFLLIISSILRQQKIMIIGMALLPATLGFFVYNFPKARIFIGDVGSQFLGLTWAVILLICAPYQQSFSIYTIPLLFTFSFLDISITMIKRIHKKRSLWEAHRTHFFQILNRVGYSHAAVTKIYMCFGIMQGIGAIIIQYLEPSDQVWLILPYLLLFGCYMVWIHQKVKHYTRINYA